MLLSHKHRHNALRSRLTSGSGVGRKRGHLTPQRRRADATDGSSAEHIGGASEEPVRSCVLKLSQNSSSAPLGSDGWQSSAINGWTSPEQRAIAAPSSRELLPAYGPWCSQVPCKPSAASARQVFQYGWGAGRWSGGRWRSEERRWTFEVTANRIRVTTEMAGDQATSWSSRAGPSLHTHNLRCPSTVSGPSSTTSTAPSA